MSLKNVSKTLHPPNWEHLAFKPKKSLKTTKELQVPPFPILKRGEKLGTLL
jgi:hypothetical protein